MRTCGVGLGFSRLAVPALGAALCFAACSDDERPRAGFPGSGGASGRGGATNTGGSLAAGAGESGAAGEGSLPGSAGAVGEAGGAGQGASGGTGSGGASGSGGSSPGGGSAGAGPDPVCVRGATFAAGIKLSLSTGDDEVFHSVTHDELSIAWQVGSEFFVADRADTTSDFGAALPVTESEGLRSVSLSPDALRLVAVNDAGDIVELTRAARGGAFAGAPAAGDFADFNATPIPTDQVVLDAVLGGDDASLVYSFVSPNATDDSGTLYESSRAATWPPGNALAGELLWGSSQGRCIPTGLSSDRLTLFYWDEDAAELRAAWRSHATATSAFSAHEALDDGERGAPNLACDVLYYSAGGDLFSAVRE